MTDNEIAYTEFLEKENAHLKEQLKKESFYYEWQNTLDENAQLKQSKKELVHENVKLQNLLHVEQMNEDEADYLISKLKEDNEQLKQENDELEKDLEYWCNEAFKDYDHTIATLFDERENLKQNYSQKIEDMKSLSDENDIIRKDLYKKIDEIIELKKQLEQLELESETLYTVDYVKQLTKENKELKELLLGYRNSSQKLLNAINRYFHD